MDSKCERIDCLPLYVSASMWDAILKNSEHANLVPSSLPCFLNLHLLQIFNQVFEINKKNILFFKDHSCDIKKFNLFLKF